MARPKPWSKLWNEWIHDPKIVPMSLAERGAWSELLSLAQECAADGHIVKGNGNSMTLREMAICLHITESDYPAFEAMVYKMSEEGSIRQNGDGSFYIVHWQDRQEKAPSERPDAVRERVQAYRERQRAVTEKALQERESSKEKEENKEEEEDIEKDTEEEGEGNGDVTAKRSLHTTENRSNELSVTKVYRAYEQNIGMLTPIIAEKLDDDIQEFGHEWVLEAIAAAVKQEKRSLAYVEGILKGWRREGKNAPKRKGASAGDPPPWITEGLDADTKIP